MYEAESSQSLDGACIHTWKDRADRAELQKKVLDKALRFAVEALGRHLHGAVASGFVWRAEEELGLKHGESGV
jgi:hypothetical protein